MQTSPKRAAARPVFFFVSHCSLAPATAVMLAAALLLGACGNLCPILSIPTQDQGRGSPQELMAPQREPSRPAGKPALATSPVRVISDWVTFPADAFFDSGSSNLKQQAKASLDEVLAKTKQSGIDAIIAIGHTDYTGSQTSNQMLSLKRALSVKAYLVSHGLPAARIHAEGRGERQPIADNRTIEGRAKNRRVEIEVLPHHEKGVLGP